MLTVVEIYSNSKEPGDWIVGRGWIEKNWPEARFPTIEELDRFSKDRPVVLERADGHAVIVNSYALNLAGIDSTTQDPQGGRSIKTLMVIQQACSLIRLRYWWKINT